MDETARAGRALRFDLRADLGYRYPRAEDAEADAGWPSVCRAALDERYAPRPPVRARRCARLEEELRVIAQLGLAGFFLPAPRPARAGREVAAEVRGPDRARALLPPGRGRGSSVSSIVCYLIGLSHVDPIANELFLGRFLNEEFTALPDIDLDFPRDIREDLIPRVHDRYGSEHSALVAAFPTYRARGAVREMGKALGLPPGESSASRARRGWSAANVGTDIDRRAGRGQERRGRWAGSCALSDEAHGLPRHLSQHSGGMIVSTRPLVDCVPLVPARWRAASSPSGTRTPARRGLPEDRPARAGDALGRRALRRPHRAHAAASTIDLSRIPYDDPEIYGSIQAADTMGVFQIESRAQMASLRRTRPESSTT